MANTTPISDDVKAEVLRLHADGLSRNAISRQTGLSGSTVTRIVAASGGAFDRAKTKRALEARQVDMAAERLALGAEMMEAAREALRELKGPVLVHNFGGKDNTFATATLDKAPMAMRREALTAAGIAFDKATRIVERASTGTEEALGMLDQLAAGFKAAAAQYRAEETLADDPE